jgi:RimJ/RimL family protein N-acetyltransferase
VVRVEPILRDVPDALRGQGIMVRPYEPGDAPEVLAAVEESRADLERRLRSKHGFRSLDDARRLVARSRGRWILREDFIAGIFDGATGRFCGGISLHPVSWEHGKFEVGYWLRASARGKGYATEALRLMSGLAFAHLGAERVDAFVEPDNGPSNHVVERAKFVLEGMLRRHCPAPDGSLKDVNVYSLIREDYEQLTRRHR